jgi:uncharacterized protein DUF5069
MHIVMRQDVVVDTVRALYHGRPESSTADVFARRRGRSGDGAGWKKARSMASTTVPRRWNTEIDGIRWLPRLIDKARMQHRGELGHYLLGHSPVDHALLTRMKVTTEEFSEIVRHAPDDAAVLTAIRARGFDEARVRRWSERFPSTYRTYIVLWDLDEGYVRPNGFQAAGLALFKPVEGAAMSLLRRVRRAP